MVYRLYTLIGIPLLTRPVGFNMSTMAKEVYDDALIDVVSASAVLTNDCLIKVCILPQPSQPRITLEYN